ncbi:MAG TPA: lysine--tRNA ligase [Phycisphaerae bacterium]|mgnify:CR=1 FL=1|nr:lysine--tRNA ligase [Phycisphaerae bacterium]HPS53556.1 lysine--tRNA ligase [Phycisphaerae bacterium]
MITKVQADRQAKLEKLRDMGVDPYGWRYDDVERATSIQNRYSDDAPEGSQHARTAGRITLLRDMGKMMFITLRDSTGHIQTALRKDALGEQPWEVARLLDLGDIIGVEGMLQRTKTGEITIWADKLKLLSKSLLPMPEKFHGLTDLEMRYRQRYLDLMTNPESMQNFKIRIAIIEKIRSLLKARGYTEVETPMLQPIYGGAAARPFTTHHNALDMLLYMRISPELYLKRLLVGGMEKVFEINRNFRNEGLSTRHNPEFTMMELYEAYADYNVMMEIAEELFTTIADEICRPRLIAQRDARAAEIEQIKIDAERMLANKRIPLSDEQRKAKYDEAVARYEAEKIAFPKTPLYKAAAACADGNLVLPYGDILLDFKKPWRRAKYADLLMEYANVNINDIAAVRSKARELKIDEARLDDVVVVNEVFEATVEEHLVQPTFVCDYPAALCPLTRRDPNNPDIALRFELFAAKMELANAYTELNDPKIQEDNLAGQIKGEEEETMRVMDEDFVTALKHGMPPAGGMGIGIDRMVMLLTDTQSIRDVILFPLLKPEA